MDQIGSDFFHNAKINRYHTDFEFSNILFDENLYQKNPSGYFQTVENRTQSFFINSWNYKTTLINSNKNV